MLGYKRGGYTGVLAESHGFSRVRCVPLGEEDRLRNVLNLVVQESIVR